MIFILNAIKKNPKQPWEVVKLATWKRLVDDYAKRGFVRDENALEDVISIVQLNILKLYVNTELSGHTELPSIEINRYFKEFHLTMKQIEKFYDYVHEISDYGLKPLVKLLEQLRKSKNAEEKLILVDRIFNVVHGRGALASLFIEGGSHSLSIIALQGTEDAIKERKRK